MSHPYRNIRAVLKETPFGEDKETRWEITLLHAPKSYAADELSRPIIQKAVDYINEALSWYYKRPDAYRE